MFTNYRGTFVDGSASLLTSTANAEILGNGNVYGNFIFQPDQICHAYINGSVNPIYIRAGQVVSLDSISSLKIQEVGITFTWIGVRI